MKTKFSGGFALLYYMQGSVQDLIGELQPTLSLFLQLQHILNLIFWSKMVAASNLLGNFPVITAL